jgi:heptose I phosphotransferase
MPADDFFSGECGAGAGLDKETATPSGKQHLTVAAANGATALHDTRSEGRKRELVRQIARLVRRFHRAGFYHRDLYLCHIFVRDERGRFTLYLIDLQRVRQKRPGQVGRRWLVKDLAALEYSASGGIVTRTDRVRFVREYLGVKRLDGAAKELVRSVTAKSGRIARHDEKKRG